MQLGTQLGPVLWTSSQKHHSFQSGPSSACCVETACLQNNLTIARCGHLASFYIIQAFSLLKMVQVKRDLEVGFNLLSSSSPSPLILFFISEANSPTHTRGGTFIMCTAH